jgi:hypothetical protein
MIPAKGNFVSVNHQYLYLMLRPTLVIFILLITQFLSAQNLISGRVYDKKGNPIPGANVYIDKTYDGASTDADGSFSFRSKTSGEQTLVVSCISFITSRLSKDTKNMQNLQIRLKESVNTLNAVMITAGTFSASDNSKISALKTMDVLTTAGAAGSYIAAFNALPGTSTVGESGELYIRGGNSRESQTYIDGLRVSKPYSSSANNTPSWARYSATLFKGMTFSTGGYSAEYGQALSGILLMDTKDMPDEEKTDISIMSVGVGIGKVIKGNKDALSLNTSYTNLTPYHKLNSTRYDWIKSPETLSGEAVYRHQFEKGMFKLYTGYDYTNFQLLQKTIDTPEKMNYKTREMDLYINSSYKGMLTDKLLLTTGASFATNDKKEKVDSRRFRTKENNGQLKLKLKYIPSESINISMGADYFITDIQTRISLKDPLWKQDRTQSNQLAAAFTESNIYFSKNTVLTTGLRAEYSHYSKKLQLAPRLSIAQKASQHSQVSFAWGEFYQLPQNTTLIKQEQLKEEKSQQFLFNYQYTKNKRLLRTELYYKKYSKLIKYEAVDKSSSVNYNNTGSGYAKGLDIFWKDEKSFRNLQYWISYSYLDTERNYKDYPEQAEVNFSNKHNLSVVGKYWISALQSQVGFNYKFASGRAYNNHNEEEFMGEKTKHYSNLSLSWSWLISQQCIFHCSATNALGQNAIYNYNYSSKPNSAGQFERQAIRPDTKHFFFAGLFITLSKNKKKNQLKNL